MRHSPTLLAMPVCLMLIAALAGAQTPPPPVAQGAYPDLAADTQGGLHLVYLRDGQLYYRVLPAAGQAWSDEQLVGPAGGEVDRNDPEIAMHNGVPTVFGGFVYRRIEGQWKRVGELVAKRDSALAVDSRGNLYVCGRGGNSGGFIGLKMLPHGSDQWQTLPDPDTAGGPKGRNDHVYAHLFVGAGDSLHVVYRHGAPTAMAYRVSTDGGRSWTGAGVGRDDAEGPSGCAGPDESIYLIGGQGQVFRRGPGEAPDAWQSLGRAVASKSRDLPVIAVDGKGNLYAACFGGRLNVHAASRWLGERTLPTGGAGNLGFAALKALPEGAAVAWEQGPRVNNDGRAGTSDIRVARLRPDGTLE